MEAEVYNPASADSLERLIVARLGERQQKIERMAEWERPQRSVWLRHVTVAMAVAAMVAVAFIVWPTAQQTAVSPIDELGIEAPYISREYRAAIPEIGEINQLIAAHNYADALPKLEQALEQSDREIAEMEQGLTYMDDDELAYVMEMEQNYNGELRWAYIYVLVQEGQHGDARAQIKQYLKLPKHLCSHRDEAKELKNAIKEK